MAWRDGQLECEEQESYSSYLGYFGDRSAVMGISKHGQTLPAGVGQPGKCEEAESWSAQTWSQVESARMCRGECVEGESPSAQTNTNWIGGRHKFDANTDSAQT